MVITSNDIIDADDLPAYILNPDASEQKNALDFKLEDKMDNVEMNTIVKVLQECDGNRTKAAQILGISRRSLHRKISKYNIK